LTLSVATTQAMADQEQLAGYDDDVTPRTAELRAIEIPPGVPAASSPELRTLVAVAVGAIVVAWCFYPSRVLVPALGVAAFVFPPLLRGDVFVPLTMGIAYLYRGVR